MPTPTAVTPDLRTTTGSGGASRPAALLVLTAAALWGMTGTAQVLGERPGWPAALGALALLAGLLLAALRPGSAAPPAAGAPHSTSRQAGIR